jgi:hypothetical protein
VTAHGSAHLSGHDSDALIVAVLSLAATAIALWDLLFLALAAH